MSAANSLDILLRPTPSADDMIEEIEEIEEEPEPETIDIKTQPMEQEISYIPVRILLKKSLSSTLLGPFSTSKKSASLCQNG